MGGAHAQQKGAVLVPLLQALDGLIAADGAVVVANSKQEEEEQEQEEKEQEQEQEQDEEEQE